MNPSTDSLVAAEYAVIGSILNPRTPNVVDDIDLQWTDFYDVRCGGVYHLIQEMSSRSPRPVIDPATVDVEIRRRVADEVELRGVDFQWLLDAFQANRSAATIPAYVDMIRDAAKVRGIDAGAGQIQQAVRDGLNADELVDLARRVIDEAGKVDAAPLHGIGQGMALTLARLRNPERGVLTPWADINSKINGLVPGRMYVVGARPSVGKSVIALQLGLKLAEKGFVAYASMEMGEDEIRTRMIAHDLEIDMGRIQDNRLTDAEWDRIEAYSATEPHATLVPNYEPSQTFAMVRRHVRSVSRMGKLSGVVVDYLQLLSADRGDRRPRHEVVAEWSRNLKNLAVEMNVPVVVLAQVNRESTQGMEERGPKISQLRESGAIEQDADVVLLLHRLIDDEGKKMDLWMNVAKNRQGPTSKDVRLDFYGHYSKAMSQDYRPSSSRGWQ